MLFAFLPLEILISHWYVVGIGLLFLLLQLYLCCRFWLRMRRQKHHLDQLLKDLENGGHGRDVEPFVKDIPWLKWVDTSFPWESSAPGSFTRDDVLNELDMHISADRHYLLLQRTGIMAPLLGVIITVIGFMVLKLPETDDQTLGNLLFAVTPLVAGVGMGAMLAFINQWLLHLVGGNVEAVRNAARGWFDAAIWSEVGLDVQAATVKAITAMERMARTVSESADQQAENNQALQTSLVTIQQTSETFQQTYSAFGGELQRLPAMLSELTKAATSAVETLQSLIPVGQRAVSGLDVSVAAFRTAVESQFVEAAKTHLTVNENLDEAVGRISESTQQLKVSCGDLQESVNSHTNGFKTLNRSLQKQVLPAHEAFLAAMSKFNGRAEGLLERLDGLQADVVASVEQMTSLAPGAAEAIGTLSTSAAAFSSAVRDGFGPATEQHQKTASILNGSVQKLNESAQGLANGDAEFRKLVGLQTQLSEDLGLVQRGLRQAVEQLSNTGSALNRSLVEEVTPSNRTLHEAAGRFADSAGQLRGFMERGLDPVLARLTELDQTLTRLEGTTRKLDEFSAAGANIEKLSSSLSRASAVTDAIAALPDQIRDILIECVRAQQESAEANARGGVLGWIRGSRKSHS